MARKYTLDGRIGALRARGARLSDDHATAVTKGSIELTMDQVSQLTVDFSDPSMKLLGSRLFDPPKEPGKAGSALDYAGLKFEVAVVETGEVGGTVTLGVTARSLGVQKMRRPFSTANAPAVTPVKPAPGDPGFIGPYIPKPGQPGFVGPVAAEDLLQPPAPSGPGQARGLSPTEYLKVQARHVGLRFVGQETAIYPMIGPAVIEQTKQLESLWEVAQRLAKEVGFVVFEAAGTLYFGQPTWLVARSPRLGIKWDGSKTSGDVLGVPTCRRTGDDPQTKATASVDVTLAPAFGEKALPGMALDLTGVPTFNGRYIITNVSIPLADDEPIAVSAAVPENPEPDPPDAPLGGPGGDLAWGGLVDDQGNPILPSGNYGGVQLDSEQTKNAAIIYKVGRQLGLGQNDRIMALMCAAQESSLKNISGGDRDSIGLFQQRPSQGWGTPAQIADPVYASRKFYEVLARERNRETRERTLVIQAVQRSAYPLAYAKWEAMAVALVRGLDSAVANPIGDTSGGGRAARGTAEAFVQYALGQIGDPYVFGAEARMDDNDPDAFDCSELTEWAAFRAGVRLVDGSKNQLAQCQREGTAVSVDVGYRTRGALLFKMTGNPTHVAISLGDGVRTMEAAGRGYGIRVGEIQRSFAWTHAGLVPGLTYGSAWTPPTGGHVFGDKPNER